jgi:hypothetical protein
VSERWEEILHKDFAFGETKPSSFNVNEKVFNFAIKGCIDVIECVPQLELYWDKPWGNNITIKVVSTKEMYQALSDLLQFVTNRVY